MWVLHCGEPYTLVHSSVSPYAPTCKPHSLMYKWCPAAQETWKRLCCLDYMALKVSHYLSASYKVLVPWLRGMGKCFYLFEDRVLLCSLCRPETCYIDQASLKLSELHLPLPPESWDQRCAPLHLARKD